jgi:peptide/nickel transport system permease protein
MLGLVIVVFLISIAILAPLLAPFSPDGINPSAALLRPNSTEIFGTDDLGRDILSRVLFGARVSLTAGILTVLAAVLIAVPVGLASAYSGGWVDNVIMRIMDMILAFPSLILALAITATLGPSLRNAMIAIAFVLLPVFARIARGQTLSVKGLEYVEAARVVGAGTPIILFRHILPNIISPIVVQASLAIAGAVLAEASLSFLGLGTQPPTPSWGAMVYEGQSYLERQPWLGLFPGFAIFLVVLGFNLLGDGLRDALDPRLSS